MQPLEEYIGAPGGCCFVCKASRRTGEVVLDFDVDVEDLSWVGPSEEFKAQFYILSGPLQICSTCIVEAAQLLGMLTSNQAAKHDALIAAVTTKAREATKRADRAEKALDALRSYDEASS